MIAAPSTTIIKTNAQRGKRKINAATDDRTAVLASEPSHFFSFGSIAVPHG